MSSHLIQVGNSLGVRIPKALIAQLGFNKDTDLEFKVTQEGLLISPVSHARKGWSEAFKTAPKKRKERLLMEEEIVNEFDRDEWEW